MQTHIYLKSFWIKKMKKYDSDKDIEYILDEFNFEKVKKVMDCLNWEWYNVEGIPSISDLRRFTRKLLQDILKESKQNKESFLEYSSGGFKVIYYNSGELELQFIVTKESNENLILERNNINVK